jgi:ADP-heptose:LPS heptosyltransferase
VERQRQARTGAADRSDRTVLALRALNVGDLLVAVPALRALRRAYPRHRIVLAAPAGLRPLVARCDAVDALLPTAAPDALTWSGPPPDVVVNLHGTGPQSHRALAALRPGRRIGFRPTRATRSWEGPDWAATAAEHPHERERWCHLLTHCAIPADPSDLHLTPSRPRSRRCRPGAPAPGARYGSKRWPAGRFAEVARALGRAGEPVLITGSADERHLAEEVAGRAGLAESRVLAGRTDLDQLADLVAGADLVVSGDTGIAHLASAFATPSVVLFGPVDPAQWGPPAAGPHVTLGDADLRRGDPFADDPDPALLAVQAADVLRAATVVRAGAARERLATPA